MTNLSGVYSVYYKHCATGKVMTRDKALQECMAYMYRKRWIKPHDDDDEGLNHDQVIMINGFMEDLFVAIAMNGKGDVKEI